LNWHLDVSSIEEREKILKDIATLGPWYQSFNLADWLRIQAVHDGDSVLDCLDLLGFPRDFSGKTSVATPDITASSPRAGAPNAS
jgi:hypothetical protein